jgi:hypothetical protein
VIRNKAIHGVSMNIYFSDFFGVDEKLIEKYGAFNISLINDLPLFIDPFLLFNSKKKEYKNLHDGIIEYVSFLRNKSEEENINEGLLFSWFKFPEVKQNWFGYSEKGNSGSGLGLDFARSLSRNLRIIFSDFGNETITKGSHLEKLCLIKDGVGKDHISDFTTNLIKEYLLKYTEAFTLKNISKRKYKKVSVAKVRFNYDTETWESDSYTLPFDGKDFVLLTPKDILTREDTWINRNDIISDFQSIVRSVSNDQLRSQIDNYFRKALTKKKHPSNKDKTKAVQSVLDNFPALIDYYIKYKEDNGEKAKYFSGLRVAEVHEQFVTHLHEFKNILSEKTDFYKTDTNSYETSYQRVQYLKQVIEDNDGYRVFYFKGKPIQRESDLHIMYRLTWYASDYEIDSEVNNGRGPVDFKASKGSADKTIIEFKLASNKKLKQNLANQVEVYKKANKTENAIKVILYFSEAELRSTLRIMKNLKIDDDKSIILIDASKDNKKSASKV